MSQSDFHLHCCHFYIVRHGETEWNKAGILQGHADSPLTEEGIRQAAARSQTFQQIEFADAFSSDLFRAQKTAQILVADKKIAVKTTQLLRERSFGALEGQPLNVFRQELSGLLEKFEALSAEEQFTHRIRQDIDSDEEISTRMLTFIRETAVAYPGKNVLVVSHGSIMKATLIKLGFATAEEFSHLFIDNLGYLVVDSDGIDFHIQKTEGIAK